MKIDVWSDIVCPFCYIGKRRLEGALERFEHKDEVEVAFKSFQLDASAEKGSGKSMHDLLAAKYGMSYDQAKAMTDQMTDQAKDEGLDYYFDTMIPTNTEDAHRLSHYANEQGKMDDMIERVMYAFFTESLDVSDHDTLVKLAEEVGLDKEEARAVLSEGKYRDQVLQDQQEGTQIGVQGVPFFVFNQKYAVSGAQPTDAFLEVLEKVRKEEQEEAPVKVLNDDAVGQSCSDDSC
ncbi:DsbA family oxidoreductase [Alteribacter populi]|uniref:DsbA family oxidoreductase n=1 Tax=Alteribacter populi TaxID=2011011 RepID=UPI000BBA5A97|nr:DsbA family oxidoreductase [Alteribacter populi]